MEKSNKHFIYQAYEMFVNVYYNGSSKRDIQQGML